MATLEAAGTARATLAVRNGTLKIAVAPTLQFKKLEVDAVLPVKSHPTDAGFDLSACLPSGEFTSSHDILLTPGQRALVPTGLAVAIPAGFVGMVAPRSGLAIKHGISVTNAPGIVDSGYRGELKVIVHNLSDSDFTINHGDRIAQLVVVPFLQWNSEEVDELPEADRGDAGFGSTGR